MRKLYSLNNVILAHKQVGDIHTNTQTGYKASPLCYDHSEDLSCQHYECNTLQTCYSATQQQMPPQQHNNFFLFEQRRRSDRQLSRWAGWKELTHMTRPGEVCKYEISSQMRSDTRMRSCQTQWHGYHDETTRGCGGGQMNRGWRVEGRQTILIETGTWRQIDQRGMCVCWARGRAATGFDKWARGGLMLSLDDTGEGNDHLMKSNNRNGTRDGNETTDKWRTSINNKRSVEPQCVCVCV